MAHTLSKKDLNRLLDGLEDQGCTVKQAAVGYRILPPRNGKILTLHLTLSDGRGLKNFRADVIRQGMSWPLD